MCSGHPERVVLFSEMALGLRRLFICGEAMNAFHIPSAYREPYAKARLDDPTAAYHYLRHTTFGDPELDPVMEELAEWPQDDMHRFIAAGIDHQTEILRTAPRALRDFFERIDDAPTGKYME